MVTGEQEPRGSILDPQGYPGRARNGIRSSASTRTNRVLDPGGRISQRTTFRRVLGLRRGCLLAEVDRDCLAAHIVGRVRRSGLASIDQERLRIFLDSYERARSVVARAEISIRGSTRLACSLSAVPN